MISWSRFHHMGIIYDLTKVSVHYQASSKCWNKGQGYEDFC